MSTHKHVLEHSDVSSVYTQLCFNALCAAASEHTVFSRSAVDERQKVKLLRTPCLWDHRSAGLLVFGYCVLTLLMLQRFNTKCILTLSTLERLNTMCFDALIILSVKTQCVFTLSVYWVSKEKFHSPSYILFHRSSHYRSACVLEILLHISVCISPFSILTLSTLEAFPDTYSVDASHFAAFQHKHTLGLSMLQRFEIYVFWRSANRSVPIQVWFDAQLCKSVNTKVRLDAQSCESVMTQVSLNAQLLLSVHSVLRCIPNNHDGVIQCL